MLGMPGVVAPFEIQGHGVFRGHVPVDDKAGQVVLRLHAYPPWRGFRVHCLLKTIWDKSNPFCLSVKCENGFFAVLP